MKIGDKVIITNFKPLPALVGMTGVIIDEKCPSSQFAMVTGKASPNWIVRLDKPVVYGKETFTQCLIREQYLQKYEVVTFG